MKSVQFVTVIHFDLQGDANRDLPPIVINGNQSSSKLVPAEDNSKRNGHGIFSDVTEFV